MMHPIIEQAIKEYDQFYIKNLEKGIEAVKQLIGESARNGQGVINIRGSQSPHAPIHERLVATNPDRFAAEILETLDISAKFINIRNDTPFGPSITLKWRDAYDQQSRTSGTLN